MGFHISSGECRVQDSCAWGLGFRNSWAYEGLGIAGVKDCGAQMGSEFTAAQVYPLAQLQPLDKAKALMAA